jgi:hypothetical protein
MSRQRKLIVATITAALLFVGTAIAAAPGLLYEEPTEVTTAGATLHGSINPSDKQTTYHFEYGLTTGYGSTTGDATLPKSKAWQAVSVELTGLTPSTTYHYRIVAWNGGGSKDKTVGADRSFTTADPSNPTPPGGNTPDDPGSPGGSPPGVGDSVRPVLGASVVLQPASGRVMVRRPGSNAFVPLAAGAELPVGTQVDTRRGSIALTSALPSGATQTGQFGGGRFELEQGKRGYVDLYLRGRACTTAQHKHHSRPGGASAASRPRARQRLWGRDHGGHFRTHGRNSHATVRGTRWLVEDRCDGTLTRVTSGKVVVRDTVRHKRITLTAGEHYLARNRRHTR